MSRAACPKGVFQKGEQLLDPMAQLEASKLELTGQRAHIFARRSHQIHAASGELFGLGLREVAPVPNDDAVFEPAREGLEELAIIDGGGRQLKGTKAAMLIAL